MNSARMTVHDALDHPWLREDRSDCDQRIPSNRYDLIRQRIRQRYVRSLNERAR
jgi:hypothetical protein